MTSRKIKDVIKKDEDRLFRVDKGCYIIYTGNNPSDRRPFVRMGNSGWLPSELKPLIHNIIVTNLLPYDPALELSGLGKGSSRKRYIGEENPLGRVLGYLESSKLETNSISRVVVKDSIGLENGGSGSSQDGKSYALFYNDSNIVITYGNRRIFELAKEVKNNRHGFSGQRFPEDGIKNRVGIDRRRLDRLLTLLRELRDGQSIASGMASSTRAVVQSRSVRAAASTIAASQEIAVASLNAADETQVLKELGASDSPKKGSRLATLPAIHIPKSVWIGLGSTAGAIGLILFVVFAVPSLRDRMGTTVSQENLNISRIGDSSVGVTRNPSTDRSGAEGGQERIVVSTVPPISSGESVVGRTQEETFRPRDRASLAAPSQMVVSPSDETVVTDSSELPPSEGERAIIASAPVGPQSADGERDSTSANPEDLKNSGLTSRENVLPSVGSDSNSSERGELEVASVVGAQSNLAGGDIEESDSTSDEKILSTQGSDPEPGKVEVASVVGAQSNPSGGDIEESGSTSDEKILSTQGSDPEPGKVNVASVVPDESSPTSRLPENVIVLEGNEGGSFTRRITSFEIYEYVNKIASLNGYHEIGNSNVRLKNPDLIYPGDDLITPSGDRKVTVKEGDTLWTIARAELERVF